MEPKNNQLSSAVQSFGSKIFNTLGLGDENVCLSPLSIATCFAMVIEGSDGSTKQQLMAAFDFPPDYLTQFESLLDQLDKFDALKVANSLWADNKALLKTNFVATVLKHFKQAELTNLDMKSEAAAVARINKWVAEKTAGFIPSILERIGDNSLLVLLNAVYFRGKWQHPFKADDSVDGKFYLLNGSTTQVPLMHQTKKLKYIHNESCSAVSLPYKNIDATMFVILPNKRNAESLNQLCSDKFLSEFFNTDRHAMKSQEVILTMPKFTFSNQFDLAPALAALGVTDAFSERLADFSKLTDYRNGAFLSQAVHKTFIELDETGTRAAATTAVVAALKRKRAGSAVKFEVDRPFVFAIFHHATEQVLFFGKVVNPNSENLSKKRGSEAVEDAESESSRSPSKKQKV